MSFSCSVDGFSACSGDGFQRTAFAAFLAVINQLIARQKLPDLGVGRLISFSPVKYPALFDHF